MRPRIRPPVALWLALPQAALVGFLVSRGDSFAYAAAVVFAIDVVVYFLPWQLPRGPWPAWKLWAETATYVVPMAALGAAGIATGQEWASAPEPWWFVAAVPVGGALLLSTGISLPALVRGDVAFLLGADTVGRTSARASGSAAAAFTEEAAYRGAAIFGPGPHPVGAVLSGAAFVARHYRMRGFPRGVRARRLAFEVLGAVLLTALAVASGSIYPGVVAHALANVPMITAEIQRGRLAAGA